jgi:hypothetical protein
MRPGSRVGETTSTAHGLSRTIACAKLPGTRVAALDMALAHDNQDICPDLVSHNGNPLLHILAVAG